MQDNYSWISPAGALSPQTLPSPGEQRQLHEKERGPVGTALWKTEPREQLSAMHQVFLLLHLLSFLCGLSFPRARDPQTCACSRHVCRQTLLAAMCPSHSSLRCVLHHSLLLLLTTLCWVQMSATLLVPPLIRQARTPSPFQSHLTCQGSLSASHGGYVAASLGQVPLFADLCCLSIVLPMTDTWHCPLSFCDQFRFYLLVKPTQAGKYTFSHVWELNGN